MFREVESTSWVIPGSEARRDRIVQNGGEGRVRDNNGGSVLAATAATVRQPTTGVVGTVTPKAYKPRKVRPNP